MTAKPSNAREALLAELLGDVQQLLARLEQADQSAKATAAAVTEATAQYRGQVDELVTKLRAETASIVLKTTEHAAQSLVGQQQATLQKAATQAMQQAISSQVLRRTRRDWMMTAACGAMTGSAATLALLGVRAWLWGI
jgi:phytoene dehydrogenase-like protein